MLNLYTMTKMNLIKNIQTSKQELKIKKFSVPRKNFYIDK